MDLELKRTILEDYKKAFEVVDKIASGKEYNWWVLKPYQYLTPSIHTQWLALNDKDGELYHYNLICETLERLLAGEQVEYNGRFRDAPEEIRQLLNKP